MECSRHTNSSITFVCLYYNLTHFWKMTPNSVLYSILESIHLQLLCKVSQYIGLLYINSVCCVTPTFTVWRLDSFNGLYITYKEIRFDELCRRLRPKRNCETASRFPTYRTSMTFTYLIRRDVFIYRKLFLADPPTGSAHLRLLDVV